MIEENRLHIGNLGPGDIALLKDVAEQASDNAVRKWFIAMGLDPDDPIGAQRNFNTLRTISAEIGDEDAAADKSWVRRSRVRSEGLTGKIWAALIPIAAVGALHAMWEGAKSFLSQQ